MGLARPLQRLLRGGARPDPTKTQTPPPAPTSSVGDLK